MHFFLGGLGVKLIEAFNIQQTLENRETNKIKIILIKDEKGIHASTYASDVDDDSDGETDRQAEGWTMHPISSLSKKSAER